MQAQTFDEAVGVILGLTSYHLGDPDVAETLRGLRNRVSAQEMVVIADAFTRIFYNGMALGRR